MTLFLFIKCVIINIGDNMKKIIKNNLLGFILGAIIFSGVSSVIAYSIASKDIEYDNSNSGIEATNLQDAMDELDGKIANKIDILPKGKLLNSYGYWSFGIVDIPRTSDNAVSFFAGSLIGRCDDVDIIHTNSNGYLFYIKDGVNVSGNGATGIALTANMTVDKTNDYIVIVNTAYNNVKVWFE